MVSIHMHVHLVEEAKQLMAVDPPIASSGSSRSAVPASPGLLGWPLLAAAAADDALPPAHQHIFQHTNTQTHRQTHRQTHTDRHTGRHTQTDTQADTHTDRQTHTDRHMTLTVNYKALWCMTVHYGASQSLTVLIEWCNTLAQTLKGPGCLHISASSRQRLQCQSDKGAR
jgi:hypothetical protein